MSNPYGGGYQPYEPPRNPYGGSPYEAPNPYGVGDARPSTDGISIAAFVCSLTCCAAPVGIALGIAGLVRTKDGKRSGRWAAVAGLVIGIIATIALVATLIGLLWVGTNTVLENEARVGQCVDTDETFDSVDLWKADCHEPHDAEVIAVGEFDGDLVRRYDEAAFEEFCAEVTTEDRYLALSGSAEYDVGVSTDAFDDDEPESGDWFVCFLERSDGEKLTDPID